MDTKTTNEITTSILKVRGKTLIFENSVYQISNISSVSLVDLSTIQPMPRYFLWMLIGGLLLLFLPMDQLKVLGVILIGVLIWLFSEYMKKKNQKRYGVGISLNSGRTTVLLSTNYNFLSRIVLVLNNIMNSDEFKAITFNFDQREIYEDKSSVNVREMTGSNFIVGSVTGDVVNSL